MFAANVDRNMKIIFSIEYKTRWGEDLRVCMADAGGDVSVVPLQTKDGVRWKGEAYVSKRGRLSYHYSVYNKGIESRREFTLGGRALETDASQNVYVANDSWRDIPRDLPFYSSAFAPGKPLDAVQMASFARTLTLKVSHPHHAGRLAMVGSNDYLGNWNPEKALPLSPSNYPEWGIALDAGRLTFPFEYKFIWFDRDNVPHWELNPNRVMAECGVCDGMTVSFADLHVRFDTPAERYAGIAIPVFSLKSSSSCGIGDFTDLGRFAEWAAATGMKFVQILPINDTTATKTWHDSYPYSAISVYALNPIYIDTSMAGNLLDAEAAAEFEQKRCELNALPQVDYEAVLGVKLDYLSRLYRQDCDSIIGSDGFVAFCKDNAAWLRPYAAFCRLRDLHSTSDFSCWGEYAVYSDKVFEELRAADQHAVTFYAYLQYVAHTQLAATVAAARAAGVVIKGDIPIGVSRCSVDVWSEPSLFNLSGQAGAPPDAFAADGQNWGFPTYDWEAMARDGYSWWRKRFVAMSRYFDAYRIDHILGFFRIWEIPVDAVSGVMGHFTPALPLSPDELRSRGFDFDKDRHAVPYATDEVLMSLFGHEARYVKEKFLDAASHPGTYKPRACCDTGRKVMGLQYIDDRVRAGLMKLLANVLFVEDARRPGMYHPRISAQDTLVYGLLLDEGQKRVFDEIYEDFYYVRHNDFWRESAMSKLPPLILSTTMLACAEDLGMIPACVPEVLDDLRVLSLEVQRMPKVYGQEFADPATYPYCSVCTTSTHDTSTLRGWWLEDRAATTRYYNNYLGFWGEPPRQATTEVCELIIRRHLESPSMLCILPYQDWLSISSLRSANVLAERINDPSDSNHYWRYRMGLSIEELLDAEELNGKIRQLIAHSGRSAV